MYPTPTVTHGGSSLIIKFKTCRFSSLDSHKVGPSKSVLANPFKRTNQKEVCKLCSVADLTGVYGKKKL